MPVVGRTLSLAVAIVAVAACALPPVGPVSTTQVVAPPPTAEPTVPEPPHAVLLPPEGPPVEGDVGTFTWDGFASDAPWLPGAGPVRVRPDVLVHVRLGAALEVSEWAARYTPLDGQVVDAFAAQEQSRGSSAEIAFPVPSDGTWSFQLEIWYVGRGRVTYYWQVEVIPR
jgi:hypothetical protein